MCNDKGSNPVITECTFTGNAGFIYGGAVYNDGANATMTNCVFHGNVADVGGAMANYDGAVGSAYNCVFYGNLAYLGGGAIYNRFSGISDLVNCTLADNSAQNSAENPLGLNPTGQGGAILSDNRPTYGTNYASLVGCVVWGNTAVGGGPGVYGTLYENYTDEQDLTYSTPDANGNFGANPLFVNPGAGNFALQAGSPCIDRGNNFALAFNLFITLNGKPVDINNCRRVSGAGIDIGAYEFQSITDVTSQFQIIPESSFRGSNGSITMTVLVVQYYFPVLDGPDTLVINGVAGYTLTNRSGVTSGLTPAGRPYINLPATAPGFVIPVTLTFTKTGTGTFAPTYQIYDGIGSR